MKVFKVNSGFVTNSSSSSTIIIVAGSIVFASAALKLLLSKYLRRNVENIEDKIKQIEETNSTKKIKGSGPRPKSKR